MFWEQLINGLTLGSTYALIALGYTMVYGIVQLINFAHGEIYMFGAFVGLFLVMAGMNIFVALLGAMIFCMLLGMLVERVAYRPLRGKSSRLSALISAIGGIHLPLHPDGTLSRYKYYPLPGGTGFHHLQSGFDSDIFTADYYPGGVGITYGRLTGYDSKDSSWQSHASLFAGLGGLFTDGHKCKPGYLGYLCHRFGPSCGWRANGGYIL